MSAPIERLVGLVRDWWRVDRVRISPREGRLLHLKPGDLLRVEEAIVTVIAREIDSGRPGLRYGCEGGGVTGELRVELVAGRQAEQVVWSRNGCQRRLPADEVEVYPVSNSP